MPGEHLRVRGTVQGVGFRPTVARLARARGLSGFVLNDGDGVLVGLGAPPEAVSEFVAALQAELPPLARIESIERTAAEVEAQGFVIDPSGGGGVHTALPIDAATCPECLAEVLDPYQRRYRYPFSTCTHCGPRFSIARAIPFDRDATSMSAFPLCGECGAEYADETDRRYHAQAMACHACGPKATLERMDGRAFSLERYTMLDTVDAAGGLIRSGEIVAVKGVGGYHLCCDATNEAAVAKLRERKRRSDKPFAMMARDLDVIRRFAELTEEGEAALRGVDAPIVLLDRGASPDTESLAPSVAPRQRKLGFMLPSTPMHHLMLRRMKRPIVCTSGNPSDTPPCIDDADAKARLSEIADWILLHDRVIHNRIDDSVVRVDGPGRRVVRRARGLAPAPQAWPEGLPATASGALDSSGAVWAAGAQLKSTFALADAEQIWVSPHLGDLDELSSRTAYEETQAVMRTLFEHAPTRVAVDLHPEYASTQVARAWAEANGAEVVEVQHHHAHVAAVMAEHGYPADGEPVLGFALDGLGMGEGGELWGGEALMCTYAHAVRAGTFKPVALLGGDKAAREPWRNLYAHLRAESPWSELEMSFGDLPVVQALLQKPRELLEPALQSAPKASSCGRLFDAVAAAVGVAFESVSYEGQAPSELESLITAEHLKAALEGERYPIGMPRLDGGLPYLEWLGMWRAILGDLFMDSPPGLVAARFHVALAEALVRMAEVLRDDTGAPKTVVLSGGCFQNATLLRLTREGMQAAGFAVLEPVRYPAHDGAIALGQAVVAAARARKEAPRAGENTPKMGADAGGSTPGVSNAAGRAEPGSVQ